MTSQAETAKRHASGTITVKTYEPTTYDEPALGPKLMQTHVTETFTGDIAGDGVVNFLQVLQADGTTSFVGIERVTGTIDGKQGTFVLQDAGTVNGSVVSGTWFVVPGSGTGALQGLRGEGGFKADLGKGADFTLDYWFE